MSTEPEAQPSRSQPQFGKVPRWVSEHTRLRHVDVRLYGWLAWSASPGRTVRRSAAFMGATIGAHPATIRAALRRLEHVGAVTLEDTAPRRPPLVTVQTGALGLAEHRLPQTKFAMPT